MECVITKKEKLKENVFDFTVKFPNAAAKVCPGQFLHILCGGDAYLRRPISICEVNNDELRFIFQEKGVGTSELAKYNEGDTVDVLGPLGNGFETDEKYECVALAGGGIGIFPLLELTKRYGKKAIVMLGFRTAADVMMVEEFKKYTDNVLIATNDGSLGYHGFVTGILKDVLSDKKIDMVYTCGPTPMMKAVAETAAEASVDARVSLEERMGCGIGACVTCTCKVAGKKKRVCKDGPVFNASEVEWDG